MPVAGGSMALAPLLIAMVGSAKAPSLRILDEPQFIKIVSLAIRNHGGILLKAADALKVHRNTLNRWIEQYPQLSAQVNTAREEGSK